MGDLFAKNDLQVGKDKKELEKDATNELKAFVLGLHTIKGVGWKALRHLFRALIQGEDVFSSRSKLSKLLHDARVPNSKEIAISIIESLDKIRDIGYEEYERLKGMGIDFLVGSELPGRLQNTNGGKPYWLFIEGDKEVFLTGGNLFVGIVGTRNPSAEAQRSIEKIVWLFSRYPVVIVSGLAKGIDSWAHAISIKSGIRNIAFLGHGLQVHTSKESRELRKKIIESGGAIVTEYFPKERYSRERFLRRNRLIASYSDIVIPVQGRVPGGTYSTVLHALKSNKQVIGVEMKDSPITGFLREKGCSVVDVNKPDDLVLLDKLVRCVLRKKGIDFDALSSFKKKITRLIERELSYRYVDEEFYNDIQSFLRDLPRYVEEKLRGKHVDQGDYSTS